MFKNKTGRRIPTDRLKGTLVLGTDVEGSIHGPYIARSSWHLWGLPLSGSQPGTHLPASSRVNGAVAEAVSGVSVYKPPLEPWTTLGSTESGVPVYNITISSAPAYFLLSQPGSSTYNPAGHLVFCLHIGFLKSGLTQLCQSYLLWRPLRNKTY